MRSIFFKIWTSFLTDGNKFLKRQFRFIQNIYFLHCIIVNFASEHRTLTHKKCFLKLTNSCASVGINNYLCYKKSLDLNVKFSITFITSADDRKRRLKIIPIVAHLILEQLSYILPVCLMTTWHHFLENRWVEKSFKNIYLQQWTLGINNETINRPKRTKSMISFAI